MILHDGELWIVKEGPGYYGADHHWEILGHMTTANMAWTALKIVLGPRTYPQVKPGQFDAPVLSG